MTLLILIVAVIIVAAVVYKLEKSKVKVESLEDFTKDLNLDKLESIVENAKLETIVEKVKEEAPKKVIELKSKIAKKTVAKPETKEKVKEVKSKKAKK
jgi:hypothetical protein